MSSERSSRGRSESAKRSSGRKTQPDPLYLVSQPKATSRRGFPLCPELCDGLAHTSIVDEDLRCIVCGRVTVAGHIADCPTCRRELDERRN